MAEQDAVEARDALAEMAKGKEVRLPYHNQQPKKDAYGWLLARMQSFRGWWQSRKRTAGRRDTGTKGTITAPTRRVR